MRYVVLFEKTETGYSAHVPDLLSARLATKDERRNYEETPL